MNIEERMQFYNVTGLSIATLKNGRISKTESYGLLELGSHRKVNEQSIFNACSISKFLTGILAMKLVENGYLDLDSDVNQSLVKWKIPENHFTKNKKVTLRNLLSHQSGIQDPKDSFCELDSNIRIPSMMNLLKGQAPYCKDAIEVKCEPESEFHYSDAGFCIVQQLIEDVTEKPFSQVMNDHIFGPLEMKDSHFITAINDMETEHFSCGHNKNGEIVNEKYPIYPYPAASGLWTSSFDLAKLVLELIDAVKGKSKVGLSQNSAKEMISPQGRKSWTGLGVFLEKVENKLEVSSLGWGVGFQCMMVAFPYIEQGAVIMTNTDLGVHQLEGIIGEIYASY